MEHHTKQTKPGTTKNISAAAKQARLRRLRYSFYLNRLKIAWLPDRLFLKLMYRVRLGCKLHLNHPKTFSEKLQYLKLHDRNPVYTKMADKHAVKEYVASLAGAEIIIPTLGVWERFDAIDFSALPETFVLKCTHDSGSAVVCTDKNALNMRELKAEFDTRLRRDYSAYFMEWPYHNIKPQIIAEPYMQDEAGAELKDYKIFCFHGEPAFIQVDFDRFTQHKRNMYTPEWALLDWSYHYPAEKTKQLEKPAKLAQMLSIASKLAQCAKFVRIDLYYVNDHIYFGECTFFPSAGYPEFEPDNVNLELGEMLDL